MSRIDSLRVSLEEPLLVTNGVNVRYLVGFSSSNAALFVEPERVRLFTDFRYAETARAVEGVEFVETKRSLVGALAELLDGTVVFVAHLGHGIGLPEDVGHLVYLRHECGPELMENHGGSF